MREKEIKQQLEQLSKEKRKGKMVNKPIPKGYTSSFVSVWIAAVLNKDIRGKIT
ncbi:hypothetical protein ACFVR1_08590 [Psychrobacillus sp. NPDC058041]|uniref:hypothetical protein n=1 Tax=Psychrobacillus sp. NPDC058041 TaxID=3346310 RepID=UPI0036DA4871